MVQLHHAGQSTTLGYLAISHKGVQLLKSFLPISNAMKSQFKFANTLDFKKINLLFLNPNDDQAMDFYYAKKHKITCKPLFVVDGRIDRLKVNYPKICNDNFVRLLIH